MESDGNDDEAAVRAVVDDYFKGMYRSDTALLQRAFHDNARISGYDEGKLIDAPIDKFINFIGGVPAPIEEGEPYDMEVLAVDIAGTAAQVKMADLYKGLRFTDYLTLLKLDGTWKIVNKTFHHLPREKPSD